MVITKLKQAIINNVKFISIKFKLMIMFCLFIFIILAISGISIITVKSLTNSIDIIADTYVNQITLANDLEVFNANMMNNLHLYIKERDNKLVEKIYTNMSNLKVIKNKAIKVDESNALLDTINIYKNLDVIVDTIVKEVRAGNIEHANKILNDNMASIFNPLSASIKKYVASKKAVIIKNREEVREKNAGTMTIIMVWVIISILLAILLIFFVANKTTKPIMEITRKASAIAQGDLTISVDVRTYDEIEVLANAFSNMTESLKNIIRELISSSNSLADSSNNLNDYVIQNNASLQEIAAGSEELVSTSNDNLNSALESVKAINQVASGAEIVAFNTSVLSNIIKEFSEIAETGSRMMEETYKAVEETVSFSKLIYGKMVSLESSAGNIGNIVDEIKNISDETNLLSLNASIEAARAGEAGRGFTVVAESIRKLADQTVLSTKGISQLVKTIQTEITETSNIFKTSNEQLINVVDSTHNTKKQIENIVTDSQEALGQLEQMAAVSEEQAASAEEITALVTNLKDHINHTVAIVQQINASIEEQTSSTEQMSVMASNLMKMSKELETVIKLFKLNH